MERQSGRFGVKSNYLTHSKDLQIKISQGAKHGEVGQLPGHKVDTNITIAKISAVIFLEFLKNY